MVISGLSEMELETIETAICVEDADLNVQNYVKVNIPKIMPLSELHTTKDDVVFIDRNILDNDLSSFPDLDFKIDTSNYIKINISSLMSLDRVIHKGDRLTVLLPNKSLNNMKIIDL